MEINKDDIRTHLERITRRWGEFNDDAKFEIRCIQKDKKEKPVFQVYTRHEIDKAIKFIEFMNPQDYNTYVTANPARPDQTGNVTNKDIIRAFHVFCDCDDTDAVENVQADFKTGFKGTYAVYTGMKPKRGHVYYELEEPITDMALYTEIQRAVATKFNSDISINNPARIMRIAGTINYPDKGKREKGRVIELTQYKEITHKEIPLEDVKEHFNVGKKVEPQWDINLGGFTQAERLDLENALARIRANDHWHDNVVKVTASLVARGKNDDEIHAFLGNITLAGYTYDDTQKEVTRAIQDARDKGFDANAHLTRQSVEMPVYDEEEDIFDFWTYVDPMTLPRRDFLYGRHYVRNFCSLTAAAGGVGKSLLTMAEAICMATGTEIIGTHTKKCRVAYFNAEDPYDEIQKRVIAFIQHHGIKQSELSDFAIASGRMKELLLMIGEHGEVNTNLFDKLEREIKKNKIDVLILDPLANMHTSTESNENFARIGRNLSMLADRCQIAIEIVHHTRKVQSSTDSLSVDDARGGSALVAAVRNARIVSRMTKEQGEALGVDEFIDYMKIEPFGKSNLGRPLDKYLWYKKVANMLPNYDEVVAIEEWTPPTTFDGISDEKIRSCLKEIKNTHLYLLASHRATSSETKISIYEFIANFFELNLEDKADKRKVYNIVKGWLDTDVLREKTIDGQNIDAKAYRKGSEIKTIIKGEVWL
jgi:hypothetical protein